MATLAVQDIIEAGLAPTFGSAAAGGDVAANDGRMFLWVKNGDASSHSVTVTAQATSLNVKGYGTMTKANAVVAVPASGERLIGPFPQSAFNNTSDQIAITYDDVTGMTIAAVRLPV